MTPEQLRHALKELKGEKAARFQFAYCDETLVVLNAFLVPEESDHLVKLTDGRKEYVIDAERVVWIEIG